eukprot:gene32488-17734_t
MPTTLNPTGGPHPIDGEAKTHSVGGEMDEMYRYFSYNEGSDVDWSDTTLSLGEGAGFINAFSSPQTMTLSKPAPFPTSAAAAVVQNSFDLLADLSSGSQCPLSTWAGPVAHEFEFESGSLHAPGLVIGINSCHIDHNGHIDHSSHNSHMDHSPNNGHSDHSSYNFPTPAACVAATTSHLGDPWQQAGA